MVDNEEFKIDSFTLSGSRELIICSDKKVFKKLIGEGGIMIDKDGDGWTYGEMTVFFCPGYNK